MKLRTLLTGVLCAVAFVGCTPTQPTESESQTSAPTTETVTADQETSATNTGEVMSGENYTLADIESHDNEEDCWMAVDGKVYEVTDFIGEHPGGDKILLGCGKDASSLFESQPKHESDRAKAALEAHEIGTLVAE